MAKKRIPFAMGRSHIRETFNDFEPRQCERKGCAEEINALNKFWIVLAKGFELSIWLCADCAKELRNILKRHKK